MEVPQNQFIADMVDIPARNREGYSTFSIGVDDGLFDAFCVIFRAPPIVPELSASFPSFRVLTTVSARGLESGFANSS